MRPANVLSEPKSAKIPYLISRNKHIYMYTYIHIIRKDRERERLYKLLSVYKCIYIHIYIYVAVYGMYTHTYIDR